MLGNLPQFKLRVIGKVVALKPDFRALQILETYSHHILACTKATAIVSEERIQTLWSGYGKILRVRLEGGDWSSVIVKLVSPPTEKHHPRGWNTDIGHQRKLHSYQVEEAWYRHHAIASHHPKAFGWRTAQFIFAKSASEDQASANRMIVMEDLNAAGYHLRKQAVTLDEIKSCLSWLAHFHASFLGKVPQDLWEEGTYWHLETRPEELRVMRDGPLKRKASAIDRTLKSCRYRTFVHGDAKLANFCFAEDGRVAAVDFQYVGGGCGMKDVAYFLSSCLDEDGCERFEKELLDYYFDAFRKATQLDASECDQLEKEWRVLYPVAWADFVRFLEGWMPSHRKLHRYSRAMVDRAVKNL